MKQSVNFMPKLKLLFMDIVAGVVSGLFLVIGNYFLNSMKSDFGFYIAIFFSWIAIYIGFKYNDFRKTKKNNWGLNEPPPV